MDFSMGVLYKFIDFNMCCLLICGDIIIIIKHTLII